MESPPRGGAFGKWVRKGRCHVIKGRKLKKQAEECIARVLERVLRKAGERGEGWPRRLGKKTAVEKGK